MRASTSLRRHHPQEPGFGVSGRRHPRPDPALPDAAAKSALHGRHARQATGGYRRPEESRRDRRSQHFWPAPMVEARRMASRRRSRRTDEFVEGRLKPDESTFGASFTRFYPRTNEREPLARNWARKKDRTCQPPSRRARVEPGASRPCPPRRRPARNRGLRNILKATRKDARSPSRPGWKA